MEVTINTLSAVSQEADILVHGDELQPLFDAAYEKYRKKVELKGFRKGKAPLEMIKRIYGEAIEHESLDTAADSFFKTAMAERNITPIGQPALVDMDFKRGEKLSFRIAYEVRPEITLGAYRGLAVEKPVHRTTQDELDTELEQLRRSNSTTAQADEAADAEHIVTGDVQELDEAGSPLIGRRSAGVRFLLSDRTLAPELRDALLHARVGDARRARFENRHEDHTHTVHVEITVTKVEKVDLPAFDDAFVSSITGGKVTSAEEFLKGMRSDLERYWDAQAERRVRDAIADEIVRRHEFEVPASVVTGFLDAFVEELRHRSKDRSLPEGFDEKKFRDEMRVHATWQAKWLLLKEAIAKAERISVTDDDLERLASAEAGRTGIDKDRLLAYFRSNAGHEDRLLTDKIAAFLRQHAIVREVPEAPREASR